MDCRIPLLTLGTSQSHSGKGPHTPSPSHCHHTCSEYWNRKEICMHGQEGIRRAPACVWTGYQGSSVNLPCSSVCSLWWLGALWMDRDKPPDVSGRGFEVLDLAMVKGMITICRSGLEGGCLSFLWKNPKRTGKLWHVHVQTWVTFPRASQGNVGRASPGLEAAYQY